MENFVAVVGSSNWDICMYLQKLPTPGETIGGGRLETNLGGKGANQAVACHRAAAETSFISCLGDDDSGRQIRQAYLEMGLSLNAISVIEGCSTGTACIFIDDNGENCIGLTPGANAELSVEVLLGHKAMLASASVVLLQLETPLNSAVAAAKIASENHQLVILNPAPAASLPEELYPTIDLLTPNRGELASLVNINGANKSIQSPDDLTIDELAVAARKLIAKGVGKVIVTLGGEGALLVEKDKHQLYEPYPARVEDTTAAGDCFNGYLAAGIANYGQQGMDRAIRTAMAAAAISVTRKGAIPSIPDIDEVEVFMRSAESNA